MVSVFYGLLTTKFKYMETKKEAKKSLNKYFKSQIINENDDEFKSLVQLLNKAQKEVKNCTITDVSNNEVTVCGCENPYICQDSTDLIYCFNCKKTIAN